MLRASLRKEGFSPIVLDTCLRVYAEIIQAINGKIQENQDQLAKSARNWKLIIQWQDAFEASGKISVWIEGIDPIGVISSLEIGYSVSVASRVHTIFTDRYGDVLDIDTIFKTLFLLFLQE